jgi:CHASE domain
MIARFPAHRVATDDRGGARLASTRLAAWLVLAIGIAVTAGLWRFALQAAAERRRVDFDYRVADVKRAVAERMDMYAEVLRGAAGLFDTGHPPDRQGWRRYVAALDLDRTYPGIFGIGYAPYLAPPQLDDLLTSVAGGNEAGFDLRPAGPGANTRRYCSWSRRAVRTPRCWATTC